MQLAANPQTMGIDPNPPPGDDERPSTGLGGWIDWGCGFPQPDTFGHKLENDSPHDRINSCIPKALGVKANKDIPEPGLAYARQRSRGR